MSLETPYPSRQPPHTHPYPDPIIILPTQPHSHTILLLHGLSSNGAKFGHEFLSTSSFQTLFPSTKFIFPTAKKRRSTAIKRIPINQWFDIASLPDPSHREELQLDGVRESAEFIHALIATEVQAGVLPRNIVVGGLSQGCAMALMVMLTSEVRLGAVVGMSGWLPFRGRMEDVLLDNGDDGGVLFGNDDDEEEEEGKDNNKSLPLQTLEFLCEYLDMESSGGCCLETPVFLGHGEKDEKVSCELGLEAGKMLGLLGVDVTWKVYEDFGHWYKVPDEIDDVIAFLREKTDL
ncbi:alpha/beta-hydrolase, partial [Wilcoxina mikolae CBS 423.85]